MPILDQSWNPEAQTLGYENEREMLIDLYNEQNFSIGQIAEVIGYSAFSVRKRLMMFGVSLKSRGGPNNRRGKRRLIDVSDEELFGTSPAKLAYAKNVHIATVFAEKRFRERKKGEAEAMQNIKELTQ